MTRGLVLLAVALVLAACATGVPFVEERNGPVTVAIGDVQHLCLAYSGAAAPGCFVRTRAGGLKIYCQRGDDQWLARCFAHEIRHAVEPQWKHE